MTFSIQIKYNVNNLRQKELRMSTQDNLNLPFCALWHKLLTKPMDVTFWWLLSVLEDRVVVPFPFYYEPSAEALVLIGLDAIRQYRPMSNTLAIVQSLSACIS